MHATIFNNDLFSVTASFRYFKCLLRPSHEDTHQTVYYFRTVHFDNTIIQLCWNCLVLGFKFSLFYRSHCVDIYSFLQSSYKFAQSRNFFNTNCSKCSNCIENGANSITRKKCQIFQHSNFCHKLIVRQCNFVFFRYRV